VSFIYQSGQKARKVEVIVARDPGNHLIMSDAHGSVVVSGNFLIFCRYFTSTVYYLLAVVTE